MEDQNFEGSSPVGQKFLIQPSQEREIRNVGEGQLISGLDFSKKLQNPDTKLWFQGKKRKLGEIEPKDALETLGVWANGDPILAIKKGYTTKVPPYYNIEQLGLGTGEEIRRKVEDNLTAYAQIAGIEYVPEDVGIRGETYVDPETQLVLVRIYAHENENWKTPEDKEHALFHEIGHGAYYLLSSEEKLQWGELLAKNNNLKKLAQEIKDLRENENLSVQALSQEVFADTFASIATADENGKGAYRQNYPELCLLMEKYIKLEANSRDSLIRIT